MTNQATTSMTIRMNKDVKLQAQSIFSAIGMDMTTAVNVFLRKAIQCNGFPFSVTIETPNATTMAAMDSDEIYGPFDSVKDMMAALNA
ncbi:MAG: type II toxin-antitoxin system RelB/DinJ family antitoxin [Treponemataceae bacterium]|nr:type II toxin-antitoxin system RelB/DinJ family antitoxin [Treponemataceae bacterium]